MSITPTPFVDMVRCTGAADNEGMRHVHGDDVAWGESRGPSAASHGHSAALYDLGWSRCCSGHDRGCAALHAAGVPLAVHAEIPLAGSAQLTFIAAVIGGVLLASLNRHSRAPRRRFLELTAALVALCVRRLGAAFALADRKQRACQCVLEPVGVLLRRPPLDVAQHAPDVGAGQRPDDLRGALDWH